MPETEPIPAEAQPSEPAETVEILETPKEHAPMLDIHDAHHAASTWRDFFIHIATIVLGLLIAVGLETAVEYIHHRYQVAETREVLRKEREDNRQRMAYTAAGVRMQAARLQNNLLVLRYVMQHPGTPPEKLPGVMSWGYLTWPAARSGWTTAQQTGVTALMPRAEVARNEDLYGHFAYIDTAADTFLQRYSASTRYRIADSDITHMTPSELEDEWVLLEDVTEANRMLGVWLENLHEDEPDFDTNVRQKELAALSPAATDAEKAKLAPARALTHARLAPAEAAFDKARKDFRASHPATAPE